jgi:IPT/TIG domain
MKKDCEVYMSIADDSGVNQKGILWMLSYLLLLCLFLGYSLVALWPLPPLIVTSLQPNNARPGEAATIKLLGSGFTDGLGVSFDDVAAAVDKPEDSSGVGVRLPEHRPGPSRVVVRNTSGQSVAIPNGFIFAAEDINPGYGQSSGETLVTITGTGFVDGDQVFFGGIQGNATWKSNTQITAKTPKHAAGPVDVVVIGKPDQTKRLTTTFTYADPVTAAEYRSDSSVMSPVSFFWSKFPISQGVRILLIVMVVGALGSLIHVFRSFYWYVGNRSLKDSWLLMYILLPFNGAGLAVLFYLIIRGSITTQTPLNPSSLDGYAAIAALVGMFSQQALTKLKNIAEAFFVAAEPGKDQAITTPKITVLSPPSGLSSGGTVVTIAGAGFVNGDQVNFGGVAASAVNVASSTQLTVTTPPHPAGVVDVEIADSSGQKFSLPKSFTYL